jgi:hypothetical protein
MRLGLRGVARGRVIDEEVGDLGGAQKSVKLFVARGARDHRCELGGAKPCDEVSGPPRRTKVREELVAKDRVLLVDDALGARVAFPESDLGEQLVGPHADEAPELRVTERDPFLMQCAPPRRSVRVVAVEEGTVHVEQNASHDHGADGSLFAAAY